MRYWTFDVCQLIADYDKNKKTLAAIMEELRTCEKMIENPIGGTSRGDWLMMQKILRLRETEYTMYTDMVILGMGDLPEVERMVLRMWLMDGYDDIHIVDHCGIKNVQELNKIKKLALTKFTNIVMPD